MKVNLKKKKKREVEYQIHIKGCDITFKTEDPKHYKHVELCLTGIAKLLNLVEEEDDWEKFTGLMDIVVQELANTEVEVEKKFPTKIPYLV